MSRGFSSLRSFKIILTGACTTFRWLGIAGIAVNEREREGIFLYAMTTSSNTQRWSVTDLNLRTQKFITPSHRPYWSDRDSLVCLSPSWDNHSGDYGITQHSWYSSCCFKQPTQPWSSLDELFPFLILMLSTCINSSAMLQGLMRLVAVSGLAMRWQFLFNGYKNWFALSACSLLALVMLWRFRTDLYVFTLCL